MNGIQIAPVLVDDGEDHPHARRPRYLKVDGVRLDACRRTAAAALFRGFFRARGARGVRARAARLFIPTPHSNHLTSFLVAHEAPVVGRATGNRRWCAGAAIVTAATAAAAAARHGTTGPTTMRVKVAREPPSRMLFPPSPRAARRRRRPPQKSKLRRRC